MNNFYRNTSPAQRGINFSRVNVSHLLVWLGVAATALLVMFRPSGAQALLPSSALVYTDSKATDQFTVKFDGMPTITRDYQVVLKGKKTPNTVSLTGVPLASILGGLGNKLDVSKVPYVKIRFGDTDAVMALIALNGGPDLSQTPPPMIMSQGERPGTGSFPTPAVVTGQPTADPISEQFQIFPFQRSWKPRIIPMEGTIFSVKIAHKRTSKGEIRFTASTSGDPGTALSYHWLAFDGTTVRDNVSTGNRWTTDDARTDTKQHDVRVVVTATDGSSGTQVASYTSSRVDDGATKDPGYGNPAPGTPGTPGIPGTPGGTPGTPGGTPPPVFTPAPSPSPTPTPTPTPTPPTSTPTPPTSKSQTIIDSSGLANIAQNYTTNASLTTVNGVLLSPPTVPPAGGSQGGGGGQPTGLTPLQQQATAIAESIFQPVNGPRDLWPYLVALLFALGLTGGVREWMNP